MKVLLCIRGDYIKSFAGDSKITLMTAKYLRKLGVEVDINNGDITDFSGYDVVHLFNLTRMGETYKYYKQAHRQKKNIVLTPNYWNLTKYYNHRNDIENIKLWDRCRLYREEILKGCSTIYASSDIEKSILCEDFGISNSCKVINYGVEMEHEEIPLYNLKDRYNLGSYVLCVARITPQKNQLALARACSILNVKLVLIGNINDKGYFNECMKYNNVTYLGFIDSYHIYNAYRFSKLHVLPSFAEIPGLSSLEAAAAGCNIITTKEGSAREYFSDMANYIDPYNEEELINAIAFSLKHKKNEFLKEHLKAYFTWGNYSKELYESYMELLQS